MKGSIQSLVPMRHWLPLLLCLLAWVNALASRTDHAFLATADVPAACSTVNKANVYCGMEAIQERDGNNNPRVSYTLGGGLLARTDTNGSAYYHTDGNGNVTAMVDEQGRIKARYLYDPFGNLLAQYGDLADANTHRFSGKEFHARSGLYYYGFRWYDRVASASVRKAENLENVGRGEGDAHRLCESQRLRVVEPLLPQLLSGVIPDFG